MDYVARFESLIGEMKLDGRYRTFIELERLAGEFPTALWRRPDSAAQALVDALLAARARLGWHNGLRAAA